MLAPNQLNLGDRVTVDDNGTRFHAYLVAHRVTVEGPRTVTVNGELCGEGHVFVDPSGLVIDGDGKRHGEAAP